jgi:hypothetical protein
MVKKALCVAAVIVSGAAATALPVSRAHAQVFSGAVCYEEPSWSFSPALTTTNQSGTVTFSWSATCVNVSTTPAVSTSPASGTSTFSYMGNCVNASLTGTGISGLLIGGTIAEFAPPGHQVYVLVPANPCNDSGPTPSTGVALP